MSESRYETINWSRDVFPEGSIGFRAFPRELDGRTRPTAQLDHQNSASLLKELTRSGLATPNRDRPAQSVLRAQPADLHALLRHPTEAQIERIVERSRLMLIDNVLVGPHDRFMLQYVPVRFGSYTPADEYKYIVIPSSRERERDRFINELLNSQRAQHPREIHILEQRLGLATGKVEPYDAIQMNPPISLERKRQLERRALFRILHPKVRRNLFDFYPPYLKTGH